MKNLYRIEASIDLHGMDRDYAKICVRDFLEDSKTLKYSYVAIIHGIGSGILRKTVQEVLRKNPYVEEFFIDNFNTGMTVVKLKKFI